MDTNETESEPGIIILYSSAAEVHAAMAFPTLATVRPPLRRGATPQQSLEHLMAWVDGIVVRHGGPRCLVERNNGIAVKGLYQNLIQYQHARIRGELAGCGQWLFSLLSNNLSCGLLFSIVGSGMCTIIQMDMGPFWDKWQQTVVPSAIEQ